jgi:hypothetical protein
MKNRVTEYSNDCNVMRAKRLVDATFLPAGCRIRGQDGSTLITTIPTSRHETKPFGTNFQNTKWTGSKVLGEPDF